VAKVRVTSIQIKADSYRLFPALKLDGGEDDSYFTVNENDFHRLFPIQNTTAGSEGIGYFIGEIVRYRLFSSLFIKELLCVQM